MLKTIYNIIFDEKAERIENNLQQSKEKFALKYNHHYMEL